MRDEPDLMPAPSTLDVPFRPDELDPRPDELEEDRALWIAAIRGATAPVVIMAEPTESAEAILGAIVQQFRLIRSPVSTPLTLAINAAEDYLTALQNMRGARSDAERMGEPWPPVTP